MINLRKFMKKIFRWFQENVKNSKYICKIVNLFGTVISFKVEIK